MPWRETLSPVQMRRVGIVAPAASRDAVLVALAEAGTVELDLPHTPGDGAEELERTAHAAVIHAKHGNSVPGEVIGNHPKWFVFKNGFIAILGART